MEVTPSGAVAPGGSVNMRGGYRPVPSRGGFRGGFGERGRGRGMGRGHFMGGRGGMSGGLPPPGMSGVRGMRIPRGGVPGGYQGRGGFPMRGGPPMRGARPPVYTQQAKQHSGTENNKTVSPVTTPPSTTSTTQNADAASGVTNSTSTTAVTANAATNATTASGATQVNTNGTSSMPSHSRGGGQRGRGSFPRGGGRGGYNHSNGSIHGLGGVPPEHGQMGMRRGGPPRGRGGYGHGVPRSPMQNVGAQVSTVPSLKRGAPNGPPGPKRGRYESGPYSQRPMAPKYHQQQHMPSMTQHSYAAPASHHQQQQQSHHAYESSQVDPYAQSYATSTAAYNGYGPSTGYATSTVPQTSSTYAAHHGTEYDQSQYQGYSAASYSTQQDTRYQTYGQDYSQYSASTVDYSVTPSTDYTHSQQSYDERAYAGYDSQAYQQNYANAAAYY